MAATRAEGVEVGPDWFQKMDRNHDGDVSRREFLGPRDQFDRLDRDNDGLIDPDEARAAAAEAKPKSMPSGEALRDPVNSPAPVASGNTRRPSGRGGRSRGAAWRRGAGRAGPCRRSRPRPGRRLGPQSSRLVRSWRGPGAGGSASLRCAATRPALGYVTGAGCDGALSAVIRSSRPSPSQSTATGWAFTSAILGAPLNFGRRLDGPCGGIPTPASPGDPPPRARIDGQDVEPAVAVPVGQPDHHPEAIEVR